MINLNQDTEKEERKLKRGLNVKSKAKGCVLIRVLSFFVQAVPFEFSLFGSSCLFVFSLP